MERNQRLLRSAGWLLGLVLVLWAVGAVLTRVAILVDPNEAKVDELTSLQHQNFDVVFLGNSVTYQGINPATIDEACHTTSYNLALGGSSAIEQKILLERYLAENKPPRLVVIGVTPNLGEFGEDLRPTIFLRLSAEQREDYQRYLEAIGRPRLGWVEDLLNRFPAYRHRRAIEPLLKYLMRGASRKPTCVQGHLTLNESGKIPDRWPAREAGMDFDGLRALLETCAKEKLRVLVVELPNTPSFNESVKNRDKILAELKSLVAAQPNAKFISFNAADAPQFDRKDWFGVNHFNSPGAVKFSKILAPYIKEELAESS